MAWWTGRYASGRRIGLTRREMRDMWRAAARAHRLAGNAEQARQCAATAKIWGTGPAPATGWGHVTRYRDS